MHFILAILIYPILFIVDGKVTSKFKRNFGIEHKFYSQNRLNLDREKCGLRNAEYCRRVKCGIQDGKTVAEQRIVLRLRSG